MGLAEICLGAGTYSTHPSKIAFTRLSSTGSVVSKVRFNCVTAAAQIVLISIPQSHVSAWNSA